MRDIAVLVVRLTVGGLLTGHGAQKLLGWFGGQGIEATSGWLESMNLRPGRPWAWLAGISEFAGGLLIQLGFLNPIGPILAIGSMVMASLKVHLGRPIWVTQGGAELPVTNIAVASAIAIAGPGRLSLDGLLGIRLPRWVGLLGLAAIAATIASATRAQVEPPAQEEAPAEAPAAGTEVRDRLAAAGSVPEPDIAEGVAAGEAAGELALEAAEASETARAAGVASGAKAPPESVAAIQRPSGDLG